MEELYQPIVMEAIKMTELEKREILQLNASGLGYLKISRKIGISPNTIKAFLQREKKAAEKCKACGKELTQTPGKRKRKFCSGECRTTWWNSHLDLVNRKAIYSLICQNCGTPFQAYGHSERKYCSHKCYIDFRFGRDKV